MSEELNYLLIKAYNRWKGVENSPVPISLIKDYLLLEGVDPDDIRNDIFEKNTILGVKK